MARDRGPGRQAKKQAAIQAQVDEIRREARGWYFRGVIALVAVIGMSFLSILLAGLIALAVGWCFVEGTKLAFRANELLEGQERR